MKIDQSEIDAISDNNKRIDLAKWILERNLAWISAAEVKVGVIVAVDTAMLGGLGAAFSSADTTTRTAWANLFTYSSAILIALGLFCAAMAVLPRVTGPAKSMIFFGKIAAITEVEYKDKMKASTELDVLEDLAAQIHRNSQIACDKFLWVRKSMYWSFFAVAPWFGAIVTLLKK